MTQHFWIYGFNKRKKIYFEFGTSVEIHTKTHIENFASYETAADANRSKTRLAQAWICTPGIVVGAIATASPNSIL